MKRIGLIIFTPIAFAVLFVLAIVSPMVYFNYMAYTTDLVNKYLHGKAQKKI